MSGYEINRELLGDFVDESMEGLGRLESLFVRLETSPDDTGTVEAIFRPIHSLKGNAAYFGLMQVKELAHAMENLLDAVRKRRLDASRSVVDALLPGVDALKSMLARVREGLAECEDETRLRDLLAVLRHVLAEPPPPILDPTELLAALAGRLEAFIATLPQEHRGELPAIAALARSCAAGQESRGPEPAVPGAVPAASMRLPAPPAPAAPESDSGSGSARPAEGGDAHRERTMRISEKSIDAFLEHVGELVVVEELFNHLWKTLEDQNDAFSLGFRQVLDTFSTLSDRLRSGILAIRRVEAGTLLQKVPRLVRDIAALSQKRIAVATAGEDVRIDKSYLDLLDAPLTHMVRNAADHGIEAAAARLAAGKPEEGRITVTVREKEESVELVVQDDGAGLDREAIARKGIDLGLARPGEILSGDRIVDLIFASGVSTAAAVSDISGRGVGMDVVKRAVESAGGKITVATARGVGTTFTIALPKNASTRIVDGYLVRSGPGTLYALPMSSVVEAFSAEPAEISMMAGENALVSRRGLILPVVPLRERLQTRRTGRRAVLGDLSAEARLPMVSIRIGTLRCALLVDEIIGVQKIVIKPVEGFEGDHGFFGGAAMMGDGSVAMVIGDEGLAKLAAL